MTARHTLEQRQTLPAGLERNTSMTGRSSSRTLTYTTRPNVLARTRYVCMFRWTWLYSFVLKPRVIQPETVATTVPPISIESRLVPDVVAHFVIVVAFSEPIIVRTVSRLTYTIDTRNFTGNLAPRRRIVALPKLAKLLSRRRRTGKPPSFIIRSSIVERNRDRTAVYVVLVIFTRNGITNRTLRKTPNIDENIRKHNGAPSLFNVWSTPETTPQKMAVFALSKIINTQLHVLLETLVGTRT